MTTLSDIAHWWSGDLQTSSTGDLLTVTGTVRGEQRVLRRLLTNPGDDVFAPTYGAGLLSYIGRPFDSGRLQAICISQLLLESVVAPSPTPIVTITQSLSDFSSFQLHIEYTDQPTNTPVVLDYTVSP